MHVVQGIDVLQQLWLKDMERSVLETYRHAGRVVEIVESVKK